MKIKKEEKYHGIRRISVNFIVLLLFLSLVIVVSAQPEVTRSIESNVVEPGWEVNVEISFTAKEDMTGVLVVDKVENEMWEITDMSAEGASSRINPDNGAVEFLWFSINSGDQVQSNYTIHVPGNASFEPYAFIGTFSSQTPELEKDITGDYLIMVKDDAEPPIIHSVTLDNDNVTAGDQILVTVNVTDDVGVALVTARGVTLSQSTGDIWTGHIIAEEGTDIVVNITAEDGAIQKPNTVTDTSQKYSAITAGSSPSPSPNGGNNGGGGGGGGGFSTPTPTQTPTASPNATASPTANPTISPKPTENPINETSTAPESSPTVSPTSGDDGMLPLLGAIIVIVVLIAAVFLIQRRGD